MGLSTKYLGRFDITPALNEVEVEWLRAFAAIDRRHYSEPYEVAMNPRAVEQAAATRASAGGSRPSPDPFTSLTPRDGSPSPHLDWVPCPTGCCLVWTGDEKSRAAEEWICYLIDHFLRPNAQASRDARPDFEEFTFDHVVSGVVAGCRDDNRELFLIRCRNNELSTETLIAPDPDPWR